MPEADTFECADCGGTFPMDRGGMAMNMGGETEYWCVRCKPPADAETIVNTFKAFMDPLKPDQK